MSANTKANRFQTFEERANPELVGPRVEALRKKMKTKKVDAFLVPRADAHRGENVPAGDERLSYISSFTGSAGTAIVAQDKAALVVDGRYTLQAPTQTDTDVFEIVDLSPTATGDWLIANLKKGQKVGYDGWLHTPKEVETLDRKLAAKGIKLVEVSNLVDAIWKDRPAPPTNDIYTLEVAQTGKSASDKLAELQKQMLEKGADYLVLTLPESTNWLLNIRGSDIANTPVSLGFAIVPQSGASRFFVQPEKINPVIQAELSDVTVLEPIEELEEALKSMYTDSVWFDDATAPIKLVNLAKSVGATIITDKDPVVIAKARKNAAEVEGMKAAQTSDALAMARFLSWLDDEAPKGKLTEIEIVEKLEDCRRQSNELLDISFETISGSGPNGAIVHYRVSENTSRTLNPGELMLVDSGGQYRNGTTDITRTMATGDTTPDQRKHFTLVLKGMIALSRVHFHKGATGAHLDVLARQFLWNEGLNYAHGTGHGVGALLGVHEGPCGISGVNHNVLEEGNILSNEPGFYLEGEYGIRIENLIMVVPSEKNEKFLKFDTLTYTPIDLRLVEKDLLTPEEIEWLNDYHQKCYELIADRLEDDKQEWLKQATRAI
ncbi:xaa-Pro aminopeptidase [Maritalea myrionectae]|uniref:Xaa-Pro aminopeptidase n=1 Tax=Maritalea myrionectae TaxID=454601 RepID=A0A2R4MD90_9HYPH|nr:aminopeptidase P family protein [Maritalea myrionectae]AVX03970.1 xaa-Pro aminopeptidase [Maritalea myrionectae]